MSLVATDTGPSMVAPPVKIAHDGWVFVTELNQWSELDIGDPKPIIENLLNMFSKHDDWEWVERGVPVFRHSSSGIFIQLDLSERQIKNRVAFWVGDMMPFCIFVDSWAVTGFIRELSQRDSTKTIEQVGILAALVAQ